MNIERLREMSLAEASRILARHWRLSAMCLLASLFIAILALWIFPRSYRSESQLYIRLGRDSASLDATATIGRTSLPSSLPSTREEEINTVTEILNSRALAEQVIGRLGTQTILHDQDPDESESVHSPAVAITPMTPVGSIMPVSAEATSVTSSEESSPSDNDRDSAITKLQRMLQVQAVKKSDVVHIDCESRNPHLSQKIVGCLVDCYLADHLRLNRTSGAHAFFQEQADRMHAAVARSEEEIRNLKDQTGLAAPETQRDLLVSRAAHLEDELASTTTELASTEAQARTLRQKIAALPATTVTSHTVGVESHGVELMRDELYRLQMAVQDMESKYTDEHILLKQARERLVAAKKSFESAPPSHEMVTSGPNTVYEQSQVELVKLEPVLTALRAKLDKLQTQIAEAHDQIKTYNATQVQLAELSRDLKEQEANYQTYTEHLEQTRIDDALEADRISNISVFEPATFEPTPIKTKSHLAAALILLMGLTSAIGLPLLLETRNSLTNDTHHVPNHSTVPLVTSISRRMSDQLSGNST
ncbi:MAG TPA: hypothetical protein VFE46_19300 [Pirellulales bacterium]|nr:hypothetical protein [Pirellulales bacterium]